MANWFLGRALAEEAEAENAPWSFLGEGVTFWVTVAVLLVVGVAVYLVARKKSNKKSFWTAKTMAVGAMCMALSSVLSLIKLWPMPMGGSVTPRVCCRCCCSRTATALAPAWCWAHCTA